MITPCGIVTLLTDFGLADAYVGAVKGVVLSIHPAAIVVDLTHDVASQDIPVGAWHLRTAHAYFPPGTVHCAVVDPGVGTGRRAIAAACDGQYFVGPDNGLLSWAVDLYSAAVHELANTNYFLPRVAPTFHGRDVFAPVAAHLSRGVEIASFGPRIDDPVLLSMPRPQPIGEELHGEVLLIDRFGNLITSVDEPSFTAWGEASPAVVECAGQQIDLADTYGRVPQGKLVALFGSAGHLEIAVRDGSAAQMVGARRGAPVRIRRR